MRIYIPDIAFKNVNKKSLFILTRPFLDNNYWNNNSNQHSVFKIDECFKYTPKVYEAAVYFIPLSIQNYTKKQLQDIDDICKRYNIKAYGYIGGDFGSDYGFYKNIIFYRMSGFKSQLGNNNQGFPVMLSDHFERIYKKKEIEIHPKKEKPVVGFCGHATLNLDKRIKENIKFLIENCKRFFKNPFRKDYEPLFASAYQRAKLLTFFEQSEKIKTNFIYRKHYRGGATNEEQRKKTTLEYYDNIKTSDYVLCVRGAGNFSVRFYETLMMGRIPIFINTDCLLPFEDKINWKEHVVWVEWKDRKKIAEIVANFDNKLTDRQFQDLQISNRNLWKERLSINAMLQNIKNDI